MNKRQLKVLKKASFLHNEYEDKKQCLQLAWEWYNDTFCDYDMTVSEYNEILQHITKTANYTLKNVFNIVCNEWMADIKMYRDDFKGSDISDIDQSIAFEVAEKMEYSGAEYEVMSMSEEYNNLWNSRKSEIEALLKSL